MTQSKRRNPIILLIDDDPGDRELTRRALTETDFACDLHVAGDGVEALEFLQNRNAEAVPAAPLPDIILLDLNMPRMDGRRFLQAIARFPQFSRIPIIVLTTSNQEKDIAEAYDLGCKSFITKPADIRQFTAVIGHLQQYWFKLITLPPAV